MSNIFFIFMFGYVFPGVCLYLIRILKGFTLFIEYSMNIKHVWCAINIIKIIFFICIP